MGHTSTLRAPLRSKVVILGLLALLFGVVATSAAGSAAASSSTVHVSELFYNPDGQSEGHEFLELYNPTSSSVDLSGWTLSSGVNFTFPQGSSIPANGYVVVAADAADFELIFGIAADGDFSGGLSNGGESILVADASGVISDSVSWDDVLPWPTSADGGGDSLVRIDPDAAAADPAGWLAGLPTPGADNQPNLGVIFGVERGWYSGSQTVTLTSTVPGATIRYNTNGSGTTSAIYTGPLVASNNGAVRVIQAAASLNGQQGPIVTHTYVFKPDLGAPVVALWPNGRSVAPGESEQTRSFEFIPPPSTGLAAIGADAGVKPSEGGIAAGESDKVFFRGAYGAGTLNADLFSDRFFGLAPEPEIDQLFLRDEHSDGTHLRQIIAQDALLAAGQLSPHGRFVSYWRDGTDQGVRHLAERPEGGFMEAYTGVRKSAWQAWSTHETTAGSGTTNGLGSQTLGAPFTSWSQVTNAINVESLIDYQLVQWQAKVSDYRNIKNFRIAGPTSSALGDGGDYRFHFFNWDMDLGYSNNLYGRGGPTGWGWAGYVSPDYLLHELDQFDELRLLASDRIACAYFGSGPLTPTAFSQRMEVRRSELVAAGGANQSAFTGGLVSWIQQRNAWLISEFRSPGAGTEVFGSNRPATRPWTPPSSFNGPLLGDRDPVAVSVNNGVLSISGAGGAPVWYRLDGGDPRLASGGQAAEAILYTGPVGLSAGRHEVIARSFDSGRSDAVDAWSPACNEASPVDVAVSGNPGASPAAGLVISELHYNPPTIGAADGDLREYIELVNTTGAAINIGGVTIDGVGYTFPTGSSLGAGDYVVIAADAAVFASTYGNAADGEYPGRLDDGGETITVLDALGATVDAVTYDDVAPWPVEADGGGSSMALVDLALDNSLPGSWAASSEIGGTPGTPNATTAVGDVNCDGAVTLVDALMIDQYAAGGRSAANSCPLPSPSSDIYLGTADITADGLVNDADAQAVLECLAGGSASGC